MKRSLSSCPIPITSNPPSPATPSKSALKPTTTNPYTTPITPKKERPQESVITSSPSPTKTTGKTKKSKASPSSFPDNDQHSSSWTPEKREAVVEYLIGRAVSGLDYDELASRVGLSKAQLKNALSKGRKYNLRDRLVEAAKAI